MTGTATTGQPTCPPVQVLGPSGRWANGFELIATHRDGTATIRSRRTGWPLRLPQGQWRDPAEQQALQALIGQEVAA